MSEIETLREIFISFAGTVSALLVAGLIWLLKTAYSRYKSEGLALVIYERLFGVNIEILHDNYNFLDQWISSLKNENKPYTAHFGQYLVSDNEHYKISDIELVNQIVYLNYKLYRASADFDHLQKNYWDRFKEYNSIQDQNEWQKTITRYHQKSILPVLESMAKNREHLEKAMLKVLARIKVIYSIRKYSLFNYVSLLFKDVWPQITQARLNEELERLHKEVNKRKDAKGSFKNTEDFKTNKIDE